MFDAVALFVEVFIEDPLQLAVALGRNDRSGSHGFDVLDDRIRIVALVGNDSFGLVLAQQGNGFGAVIELSAGEEKIQGQAQLVRE